MKVTNPVIDRNGSQKWYQSGKLHREDGPAFISKYGDEYWYYRGKKHREGGPAITYGKGKVRWWIRNGEIHREDGPAIIDIPEEYHAWYIDDEILDFDEYCSKLELSNEDIFLLKIKYNE